jgi:chloride channel protein, CIC family
VSRWRSEVAEQGALTLHILRWIVLGVISGLLAGVSSWVFLEVLDRVTDFRVEHDWLLFLLPVAGLLIGVAYHHLGGRSSQGNALLIDEIHEPTEWVPRRMAPFVLVGTWITHLFGGSAGREGTALQMSGSLTDGVSRLLRLDEDDRRLMLITALGGGFGAVFGVPLAGAVFALEVQAVGRVRYEALVPALTASLVGDLVVGGLGYEHAARLPLDASLDAVLLLKIALAGLAFGLTGALFAELTHGLKSVFARWVRYPPLRLVIGGVGVIGLALVFGYDYLGLSLPLIDQGLSGADVGLEVFALKMIFTVVTLASGFPGGEVTPLFVIGTTLGAALADPLGLDPKLLAAVGFVAVFAGAANVPLACTIMGVEIFGAGIVMPLAVGCVISYVFSSHRGIYTTQRIEAAKGPTRIEGSPTIHHWSRRRR